MENTSGYTKREIETLNDELTERLRVAGAKPGTDEAHEIEKAFQDEVSQRVGKDVV